ncbi:MAG: hypothetical protein JW841_16520 [Deltaproteobacteria bacterium]|nr:hypothetical protein [Deltaproteobacteria bacterium]
MSDQTRRSPRVKSSSRKNKQQIDHVNQISDQSFEQYIAKYFNRRNCNREKVIQTISYLWRQYTMNLEMLGELAALCATYHEKAQVYAERVEKRFSEL